MTLEICAPARKKPSLGRWILNGLGALAFPSDCVVCGELLSVPLSGPICPICLESLPRIAHPYCPGCGLPYFDDVTPGFCGPCRSGRRAFRRARAGFVYGDDVRRCLHALKFGGRPRLATILGVLAAERWVKPGELDGYGAVVPVPLSRTRRRERGFNQAELVARVVAPRAAVPILPRVLSKKENRPPQAGLSASARRANARGAYRARLPAALRGEPILLVDDVLTTGATAEAAARALLRAGAAVVDVLTLARVP